MTEPSLRLCIFCIMPSLHQDTFCRIQVVSTCIHLSPSTCILYRRQIVACLSPVCCWIQRDTSRPWHKWIVIMSPRYSLQVSRTSNLYPATCIRRHICVRIHVARPGYMFPGDMCPGVNAALLYPFDLILVWCRHFSSFIFYWCLLIFSAVSILCSLPFWVSNILLHTGIHYWYNEHFSFGDTMSILEQPALFHHLFVCKQT